MIKSQSANNPLSHSSPALGESSKNQINTDICIIGAGAGGLYAARMLAQAGFKVILLESASQPGRKLAISGGGHANFTNLNMNPDKFFAPPSNKFCIPALIALPPSSLIDFIKQAGFSITEKNQGKLFLAEGANELVQYFMEECEKYSVQIHLNQRLIKLESRDDYFLAITDTLIVKAPKIILALGSPARPKLASCLYCWQVLSEMGHKVFPARPALTPLYYAGSDQEIFKSLSGIGTFVKVTLQNGLGKEKEKIWQDDILFTHKGLSGPAILCASLYFSSESSLFIDFLPEHDLKKIMESNATSSPYSLLRVHIPARLIDALLPQKLAKKNIAELSLAERQLITQKINSWQPGVLKSAGLDSAEVCSGGVDLKQINPRSMESKLFRGLYICGEMQNVTGELGGYNLHWAFASAHLASLDIIAQ